MYILGKYQSQLSFYTHRGCAFVGDRSGDSKYVVGCIVDEKGCGACGISCYGGPSIPPYTTKELCGKEQDSFFLVVRFKENNEEIYQSVKKSLELYSSECKDQTEILYFGDPIIKNNKRINQQFQEDAKKIEDARDVVMKAYDDKMNEFYKIVNQLEDMGCDINECHIGPPTYAKIPEEYYIYDEKFDYTKVTIVIFGRNESNTYKELVSSLGALF